MMYIYIDLCTYYKSYVGGRKGCGGNMVLQLFELLILILSDQRLLKDRSHIMV